MSNHIGDNAFPLNTTLVVEADSYGEKWVQENGYNYRVNGQEDNLCFVRKFTQPS